MESTIPSYQCRRAFAAMVSNRSAMARTARLEQAVMVTDFRTDLDIDNVRWSVMMTDYAVGNGDKFGYFL